MPEETYKTVTKKSYGQRLGSSFQAILIGLLLFISSFGVLFWNEGRTDLSKVAEGATPISAEDQNINPNIQGTLVAAQGVLKTPEKLADTPYVKAGDYMQLTRNVEMYAWVENSSTESKTNLGGSETTETTYSYDKKWVSSVADTGNFHVSEGHENPQKQIESNTTKVTTGTLGLYQLEMGTLSLPGSRALILNNTNTTLPENASLVSEGKYIFIPTEKTTEPELDAFGFPLEEQKSTFSAPAVGDIRISYSYVPSDQQVTVLGKLNGERISPFYTNKGDNLYRAFIGSPDSAVQTLSNEHTFSTWMWRIIGFLMMYAGLNSMIGFVSVLLDVLPFLGSVSRGLLKLATGVIAFVLSLVTIIVSAILHNIWAVLIVLALTIAGGYSLYKKKKEADAQPKKVVAIDKTEEKLEDEEE